MSGANRLQLSLTMSQACQEQLECSNTGRISQSQPRVLNWQRAVFYHLPLIDHLIQEMKDRLLSQGGSLLRPASSPNKTARIKQRHPR